jgi:hypothetical protein
MREFLTGMITMGFLVAALLFFRFWRRTHDKLFVFFGVAFILFALSQGFAVLSGTPREDYSWIYLVRLAGFVLLIVAIVGKNVSQKAQP